MQMKKLAMPFLYLLAACFVVACTGSTDQPASNILPLSSKHSLPLKEKTEFCWTGTVNNKIPVFLHYSFQDNVIVGEITYLNSKEKKPIKVIGTVEEDTSYTILEFEADGNSTGIITGKPQDNSFHGTLFSPATQDEQKLSLVKKDTILKVPDLLPDNEKIAGNYHYQFSESGYQGFLKVDQLKDNNVSFSIFSVTEDPERNIAEVPTDTIKLTGNSFHYKLPAADSCEFTVTFYNGFATVDYTKGYCSDKFGTNATVDGVFIKVK